jgi:hypothetical protein
MNELNGLRNDTEKYMKLVLMQLGDIKILLRDIERGLNADKERDGNLRKM